MIDWKRKLSSRKFWVAVAGFVSGLIIALGGTQEVATQVSGIILSGAAVVAYILGEAVADTVRDPVMWVEEGEDDGEEDK